MTNGQAPALHDAALSGEGRRSRPHIGSRGNGIGGIGDGLEHRPDILIRRVAAVGAGWRFFRF